MAKYFSIQKSIHHKDIKYLSDLELSLSLKKRVRKTVNAFRWIVKYIIAKNGMWLNILHDRLDFIDNVSKIESIKDKEIYKEKVKKNKELLRVLYSYLKKAFEINYEAHIARNRFLEERRIEYILNKPNYLSWKNKIKKDRLYAEKVRLLNRAVKMIEEDKIEIIDYWLRDWILFFKYKEEMITFHTMNKVKAKHTDIIWDWKRHHHFPF